MRNRKILILILILVTGCKKPYNPPGITAPNSYLVVEGIINSGSDSTIIKLSRTVNIASSVSVNPVTGAGVTVESDQGTQYPLAEAGKGTYTTLNLNLDNSHKYRLHIKTTDDDYLSDFVSVVNSPPIDSVNFVIQSNGLTIYSNTHDPNNNTRYYRWDYQETWIIHPPYESHYKSNGDTVITRNFVNDNIYTCWVNAPSSTIVLNSSAKLSRDVIVNNPIIFISSTSEKLAAEYSIMVRQYALSADAYSFWQNLKKNSEQLGSIFDAQPSQINGNIHSTVNAAEPVIGYISVGSVTSTRLFIKSQQLPDFRATPTGPTCHIDSFLYRFLQPGSSVYVNQVNQRINYNKGATFPEIPIEAIYRDPGTPPVGYTAADRECTDCTLRGTNIEPSYWK